jgi:trehalose/maltose hydrolase-like predicted phosphorylase
MGPDEYHDGYPDSVEEGLRNNTYTNVMAVWVLQRALEALQELPPHYRQELAEELAIRDEELELWRDISRKMIVVFHVDGVLSQFEGYEQLREFDWETGTNTATSNDWTACLKLKATARITTRCPSRPMS